MPACSILVGYMCKICTMCLHVQFSEDMCTSSVFFFFDLYGVSCLHVQFSEDMCTNYDLYRICACIFNSWRICALVLCFDLLNYFWMKDLLGMLKESLGSIILLISVLVMILTYHEVMMVYGPLRKGVAYWDFFMVGCSLGNFLPLRNNYLLLSCDSLRIDVWLHPRGGFTKLY